MATGTNNKTEGIQMASALLNSAYKMNSSFTVFNILDSMSEKGIHKPDREIGSWLDRLVSRGVLVKVNDFYSIL